MFCDKNNFVSKVQGSGKKSTRTSDHLMVIKFLIDKIVKGQKKNCLLALSILKKHMIVQTGSCYFTN
jgi:hypothetical protein